MGKLKKDRAIECSLLHSLYWCCLSADKGLELSPVINSCPSW